VTRRPDDGQSRPGRGLSLLVGGMALALTVAAAALLLIQLSAPPVMALPPWLPSYPYLAWFVKNGTPLVALATAALGVLVIKVAHAPGNGIAVKPIVAEGEASEMERLLKQIAPLATGDLAVRLPDSDDPRGDVARVLRVLIGGVSDLVETADEVAVQLLGLTQDLRAHAAQRQAGGKEAGSLVGEMLARAEETVKVARLLEQRIEAAAPGAPQPAYPSEALSGVPEPSLAAQLDAIVEVIADLAEYAHVLAVEVGVKISTAIDYAPLAGVSDEIQELAERAAGAVRRIEPLVRVVGEGTGDARMGSVSADAPGGMGDLQAAKGVIDQMMELARRATRLQSVCVRMEQEKDDALPLVAPLSELAQRLRRATGRFRLPA